MIEGVGFGSLAWRWACHGLAFLTLDNERLAGIHSGSLYDTFARLKRVSNH
jgi:hypothetical protein